MILVLVRIVLVLVFVLVRRRRATVGVLFAVGVTPIRRSHVVGIGRSTYLLASAVNLRLRHGFVADLRGNGGRRGRRIVMGTLLHLAPLRRPAVLIDRRH